MKKSMKKLILFAIKSVTAGGIALAVLSVISICYNYTGVHIDNKENTTDYVWESQQIRTNMTEGFAWIDLDKYGFNNTDENAEEAMNEGVDILLMGSSHMEAMQVSEDENLGAILNQRLDNYNTYNIGMSGHDVYRVMDNMYTAVKVYQPKEYLLVEIDEIELSVEKMLAVINETAKEIPSYDSGLVYHMQKVPAIKWIYKSIDEWMAQSKTMLGNGLKVFATDNQSAEVLVYKEVLEQFLDLCVQACKQTGCVPIIFYHQQADIESDGKIKFDTDKQYLNLFAEICEKKNIIFIDMTPEFMEEYKDAQRLPHGFFNTYVGSGHVNEHGHEVMADKLIEVILKQKGEY